MRYNSLTIVLFSHQFHLSSHLKYYKRITTRWASSSPQLLIPLPNTLLWSSQRHSKQQENVGSHSLGGSGPLFARWHDLPISEYGSGIICRFLETKTTKNLKIKPSTVSRIVHTIRTHQKVSNFHKYAHPNSQYPIMHAIVPHSHRLQRSKLPYICQLYC